MMIPRLLTATLRRVARRFPVVTVTGPRQSGKTTLVRQVFAHKPYASLEDLDIREFALTDPRGFLRRYVRGAVLDEIQRAPSLFSYLQTAVDEVSTPGRFILTGSQHFALMETLSQTLAGRVAILHLLPFGLEELRRIPPAGRSLEACLFTGGYPRIYDRHIPPTDWYPSYIDTYLERDVRLLKHVHDLMTFQRFLKLCAARTGQVLNLSSLANDCGLTHNTAKSWLGVLQTSFIVHLLPPHHANFRKRLIKSPKLYFYDTGLACSLLGIERPAQLDTHPLRGPLVETLLISELLKHRHHLGLPPNLYFWRDKTGHEVDAIVDRGGGLIPVEITSSHTITTDHLKPLRDWLTLARRPHGPAFLIYGGTEAYQRHGVTVVGWQRLEALYQLLR